jgi:hypothetical protein
MSRAQIKRNIQRLHALAQTIKTPQQFEQILNGVRGGEKERQAVKDMLLPMLPFKYDGTLVKLADDARDNAPEDASWLVPRAGEVLRCSGCGRYSESGEGRGAACWVKDCTGVLMDMSAAGGIGG